MDRVGSPHRIGKYDVLDVLGQGGMGVVYRAHDPVIGREVAIKVILDRALEAPAVRERFYREARSAGALSHENVMTIFDVGEDDGRPYIVMELLDGTDVRHLLARRPMPPVDARLDIALQVCNGLGYAHSRGVIHRDVKPENVQVTSSGRVKLLDFGIARIQAEQTLTQAQIGTPRYMSPEQIKGEPIDGRSDIFSFGVVLYELLAGSNPFHGEHVTAVIYKVLHEDPPPPPLPNTQPGRDLQRIVARCLAKAPHRRYANFAEVADALRAVRAAGVTADDVENRSGLLSWFRRDTPRQARPETPTVALTAPPPTSEDLTVPVALDRGAGTLASDVTIDSAATFDSAATLPTVGPRWPDGTQTGPPETQETLNSGPPGTPVYHDDVPAQIGPAHARTIADPRPPRHPPARDAPFTADTRRAPTRRIAMIVAPLVLVAAVAVAYRAQSSPGRASGPAVDSTAPGVALLEEVPGSSEELPVVQPLIVDDAVPDAGATTVAPQPGLLDVRSEPAGARVYIDGTQQGLTPMRLTLAAGRYDVRLTREGYGDVRRTANVAAGATARVSSRLTAAAAPAREGTVRVTVRPWGDVFVDGAKRLDQASHAQTLTLPPGRYSIAAVHPTLGRSEQLVTVTAGQQATFDVDLRPAEITVTAFDSTGAPLRGEILLDGASTGRWTPSVISVPLGQHQFEVRSGSDRRSRSVNVTRGTTAVRL